MNTTKVVLTLFIVVALGCAGFFYYRSTQNPAVTPNNQTQEDTSKTPTDTKTDTTTPTPTTTPTTTTKPAVKKYNYDNKGGRFRLNIPKGVYYSFDTEKADPGFSRGVLYLSTKPIIEGRWGLALIYVKPYIDGKGGMCVDEDGEGAYKKMTIAKQSVDVCEVGNDFSAQYFKNPKADIEYWITTSYTGKNPFTKSEMTILKNIVIDSLSFY